MADEAGLDLVEVAPNADPPVCRVMDYGKFKYEKSKKTKEARKKQHVVHLKEVKFRPKTGEHDYRYKMEHARDFLMRGDRVKATVVFRGREVTHMEFGDELLTKLTAELAVVAQLELTPRREGRNLIATYVPDRDKIIKYQRTLDQERKRREAAEAAQAAVSQPAATTAPAPAAQPSSTSTPAA